ncbi:MAG: hypothetical protein RIF32_18965 [Leptospirales bacterium]|jgi:signal transduction histidine kinase
MELTQSQLIIVGSLTGAATHELNNIMGILSLRLEKVQEDLQSIPAGDGDSPGFESRRFQERDAAAQKDLSVMERNLERAVGLIGHLQWLMRAGTDARICSQPEEFQRAILEAIQTQQAIYERKAAVNHSIGLASIRPVRRGRLHLFLVGALQRTLLSLGRGSELTVEWSADPQTGDGHLRIHGSGAGNDPGPALPRTAEGPGAVLDLLAGQTEELAASLAPEYFQKDDFAWSLESVTDASGDARRREVKLSLRLPAG